MFNEGYVLFSGDGCSSCVALKSKLNADGVDFKEFNVWKDHEALDYIMSKGYRTIPQLFKDGEKVDA